MEDDLFEILVEVRPDERVDVQLVPVRRGELVHPADVLDRNPVPEQHEAAALVRRLLARVRDELCADRGGDYHQSTASSISSPLQNGAERYFQPPSASTATTVEP